MKAKTSDDNQISSTLYRIASWVREGYEFRHIVRMLGYAKFKQSLGALSMYRRLSNETLASIVGVSATTICRWIMWLDAVPKDVLEAEKRKRIVGRLELAARPNGYEKVNGYLHYVSRFIADPSLSWLVGFVAGDGSVTRRHVFVYNSYKHLVDQAARIMSEYGTVGRATRRGRFEAWLSSRALASALTDPGCHGKLLSSPRLATSFIGGLFDAEGWISFVGRSPSVNIAMTNKRLLLQIRKTLRAHLEIESRIRLRIRAGRVSSIRGKPIQTRKDFWELRIFSSPFSNVARWARLIGNHLEHPVKKSRAAKILEYAKG